MSKYNGNRFSVYDSQELTALGLIEELANYSYTVGEELKNKTDLLGDHKGSWQGLNKPTLSEEGMRATVEKHEKDITDINSSLEHNANEIYKKWGVGTNSEFLQRKMDYLFGSEYLFAFQKHYAINKNSTVVFSGDSTTAGYAVESPDWIIDKAFKRMAEYRNIVGLNCINKGYLGESTEHWNRNRVAEDIALNPKLYVLRWGINEPTYDKNLNNLPDDGLNYEIRRNAEDFYKSLDEGLTKFRQTHSVADCSIVLMSPNSTSDDLSFRNEKWHESINDSIRFLARKHGCTFIDTYRLYQDSRVGLYMDVINNGHIHPLAFMNLWIVDSLFNTVFPDLFIREYCKPIKTNLSLSPSWSEVGFGFETPNYLKDGNFITLNGLAKGLSGNNEPIAILPEKCRPKNPLVFSCATNGNTTANISIKTNGEIGFQDTIPSTAYEWVSLSNIIFYI